MNTKSLPRRGVHRAFLTLLWLSAASAMGCTQCSPSSIFTRDAGPPATDAATDAATNACDALPNPPAVQASTPKPCRYWVVNDAINKGACASVPAPGQPGKSWQGSRLFGEGASDELHKYCNYQWSDQASDPTSADIAALPNPRSANCTYITPQQATPDPFTTWARDELLPPVTERLPASGAPENVDIKVRVVVLDTAPFNGVNSVPSRHGRTLAQLIRESSCQNAASTPPDCAVEVRASLAMPRTMNSAGVPQIDSNGGYFGLLSDVSSALWLETIRYRRELGRQEQFPDSRRTVPARVIFNESFGFGNTDAFPNRCSDTAPPANDVTASALFDAMTAAACLGVLHVAAAGNHTGGSSHLDGMLCPARWDHAIIPTDDVCKKLWGEDEWNGTEKVKGLKTLFKDFSIAKNGEKGEVSLFSSTGKTVPGVAAPGGADALLSVGGVDYHGSPIVLSRPKACPEAVAIGIGGIGLGGSQDIHPFLFGTSVSAAVASSRIAIRWAQNPLPTASAIHSMNGNNYTQFQRQTGLCGGTPVACPGEMPWIGKPATAIVSQNREWPVAPPALLWLPVAPTTITPMAPPVVCLDKLPHCQRPSRAITSDVWPQPVDPVCLKCGIYMPTDNKGYPELWIEPNPSFIPGPTDAILVVEDGTGAVLLTRPVSRTSIITTSRTVLSGVDRPMFTNARVWLSGYDSEGKSYSQQIFVDQ